MLLNNEFKGLFANVFNSFIYFKNRVKFLNGFQTKLKVHINRRISIRCRKIILELNEHFPYLIDVRNCPITVDEPAFYITWN